MTTATIIKTIIGAGILSMPIVTFKLGWVFALIIFILATILSQFSSALLLKSKNLSGHSNLASILFHIKQSKWSKALGSIVVFLNNIGICNQKDI